LAQKLPPGRASPPPVWFSSSEQQLIVTFAARYHRMSPERAQELAQILNHAALRGDVDSLLGHARHIVGEREPL
jgi:hypothetical protein